MTIPREDRIKFIKRNPDMKNDILAHKLGVSMSTVNLLKKEAGVSKQKITKKESVITKKKILAMLQKEDRDVKSMASELGISINGVRNHLYQMRRNGLVDYDKMQDRQVGKWSFVRELTEPGVDMHSLPMTRLPDYFLGRKEICHEQ